MLPIDCFRREEKVKRLASHPYLVVQTDRVTEISHGNYILKCCFAEIYIYIEKKKFGLSAAVCVAGKNSRKSSGVFVQTKTSNPLKKWTLFFGKERRKKNWTKCNHLINALRLCFKIFISSHATAGDWFKHFFLNFHTKKWSHVLPSYLFSKNIYPIS